MTYDETLFAGAAEAYARYRTPYPQQLIDDLVVHLGLDGTGRLLDLGCGPGTLTLPLAPHFTEVVAIDPQPEMIDVAQKSGAPTVDWRVMAAEDVPASIGRFRLVSCGSSIHWMDRDLVLGRARDEWLEPGCGVALVGGGGAWLDGPLDWHQAITRLIRKYLGEERRAGKAQFARYVKTNERFQQTLARLGWRIEVERDYEVALEWTIDEIIGLLHSTSFAAPPLFEGRADDFERDLRTELASMGGVFRETEEFGLVCGRP